MRGTLALLALAGELLWIEGCRKRKLEGDRGVPGTFALDVKNSRYLFAGKYLC